MVLVAGPFVPERPGHQREVIASPLSSRASHNPSSPPVVTLFVESANPLSDSNSQSITSRRLASALDLGPAPQAESVGGVAKVLDVPPRSWAVFDPEPGKETDGQGQVIKKGDWKQSTSFGKDDLLLLAKIPDLAHAWIYRRIQGDRHDKTF